MDPGYSLWMLYAEKLKMAIRFMFFYKTHKHFAAPCSARGS